jgi:putative membrane protein
VPSLLTSWNFEPLQVIPTLLIGLLYARRVRTLREAGTPVAAWRLWCFGSSLFLVLVALVSPIDAFGEEQFLFMHMVQHILLGDLAPLLFVLGLTGPILRPVLSLPGVLRLRFLLHPLVALPVWAASLYIWHIPFLYQAALHHSAVHALEHFCFFAFGAVMWAPVVEVLPGPEWFGTGAKLGYVLLVRLVETILGNVFIWSGKVFYPFYEHPVNQWGISALSDQQIAGAAMMVEGSIVTLGVLAWLFLKMAQESELRQRLLEQGMDERAVKRAVRYGRAGVLETE